MEQGCPVCGSEDCRPHGYTGPLPRVLGGEGMDAPPEPKATPRGRRRRQSEAA